MSNKSGIAANVIGRPQGGGALQGIGEKFTPNMQTGTGNFTIPLELPPKRDGFQQQMKQKGSSCEIDLIHRRPTI